MNVTSVAAAAEAAGMQAAAAAAVDNEVSFGAYPNVTDVLGVLQAGALER